VNLASGRRPSCPCLGRLGSTAIGPSTLVRNGVLAALAGLIAWQGPDQASLIGWTGRVTTAELISLVVAGIALVVSTAAVWLLVQLAAQNGRMLSRLDTLQAGLSEAPTDTPRTDDHAHAVRRRLLPLVALRTSSVPAPIPSHVD
jgi:hypothetical protein